MIVRGPEAYISPSWYAAKAEHGRVVPTWNYVTAHVHGRLVIHDDPDWLDALVRRLTDRHEAGGGTLVGRRRPAAVRRRAAARDRRRGVADQPDRGQAQAQPEPARRPTSTAWSPGCDDRGDHAGAGAVRDARRPQP